MALAGVTIHDPDVVVTDLALALLSGYFAYRLKDVAPAMLMTGLAGAAFWGAVFHGLFPSGTASPMGFAAWMPVAFSIALAATTLVALSLEVLAPRLRPPVKWSIVAVYAASFAVVVLLVDASFGTIVRFYGPALGLFLLVALARTAATRHRGWTLLSCGLMTSVGAALIQQMRLALHPVYFDHNAVYHVVQGVALVLLYQGFRLAPGLTASGQPVNVRARHAEE
jgi:hypothetical protein